VVPIATDLCRIMYPSVYINRLSDGEMEISDVTKFRVTVATNYRMLTLGMNVIYLVGHEQASSLLCQSIVPIL
jgi:hypothetical protein